LRESFSFMKFQDHKIFGLLEFSLEPLSETV